MIELQYNSENSWSIVATDGTNIVILRSNLTKDIATKLANAIRAMVNIEITKSKSH